LKLSFLSSHECVGENNLFITAMFHETENTFIQMQETLSTTLLPKCLPFFECVTSGYKPGYSSVCLGVKVDGFVFLKVTGYPEIIFLLDRWH